MLRLIIPFLAVVVFSWVMLYGLKPKVQHDTWKNIFKGLTAVSVGFGVILVVFIVFSLLGVINHG